MILSLLLAAQIAFAIQIFHSIEEIITGFHKKWYLIQMPRYVFVFFEICFILLWYSIIFTSYFANKDSLLFGFILLMFANGVQHLVWLGLTKHYIPGVFTSFFHLAWSTFSLFYIFTHR